jgi:hypothetical protein
MKQDSYATKLGVGTWGLNVPVRSDRSALASWKQAREESTAYILAERAANVEIVQQPVAQRSEAPK